MTHVLELSDKPFFKKFYLFTWLSWVLVVACGSLNCGMQILQLQHENSLL